MHIARAFVVLACALPASCLEIGLRWDNTAYALSQPLAHPSYRTPHLWERLHLRLTHQGRFRTALESSVGYAGSFDGAAPRHFDLYHAFVDWRDTAETIRARVGRQQLHGLVDPIALDGADVQWRVSRLLSLEGAAGIEGPDPSPRRATGAGSESVIPTFGGKLRMSPGTATTLGLIYQHRGAGSPAPADLLALELRQYVGTSCDLFGLLAYSTDRGAVDQYLALLSVDAPHGVLIRATADYQSRPPTTTMVLDSLLWRERHSAGAGIDWSARPTVVLSLNYRLELFPGIGIGHKGRAAATVGPVGFSYTHHAGDGGSGFELSAGGDIAVTEWLSAGGGVDYLVYRVVSLTDRTDRALAATTGVRITPGPQLTVSGEVQFLRNRYYAADVRALLGATMTLGKSTP